MAENIKSREVGTIVSLFSGVAKVVGFNSVFVNEVLLDKAGDEVALVMGFDEQFTEVLFFSENFSIKEKVFRSGRRFSIKVDDSIVGRVVNGFGNGIDSFGEVSGEDFSIFSKAPAVYDRAPVTRPLITGIKVIDVTLPLGRGQRELIIGDRKIGKSTIAEDIVLNQKNISDPVICVYVLIGQKEEKIKKLISLFERNNAFLHTVVVAVPANASFAEIYLAPFVGSVIGEYFRDTSRDALVIYDDLSKHAKAYRDVSLLLERVPGREAYPGDIFSLHAKLLERPAQLSDEKGGGSLSALPIIETQQGDITSYVPTNIISITDGQIYLESDLFQKGFLPAVNIGLSVSRIGSAVQPKVLKNVISGIRLSLAQHKELQKLAKLETAISMDTANKIHRGNLMLELLKQGKEIKIDWTEQVVLFYTVEKGFFDDLTETQWSIFEELFLRLVRNQHFKILEKISHGIFSQRVRDKIKEIVIEFKEEFLLKDV